MHKAKEKIEFSFTLSSKSFFDEVKVTNKGIKKACYATLYAAFKKKNAAFTK